MANLPGNLQKCFAREPYLMFLDGFEFAADLDYEDFTAWFRTKENHRNFLCRFAQDGTGGMFCFWNKEGGDDYVNSPVVFLGSEGEIGVVSDNFDNFLRILSTGFILYSLVTERTRYHFSSADDDDEETKEENAKTFSEFLGWLKTDCNITPADDLDAMLAKQGTRSIEFIAWVEGRKSRRK